MTEIKFRIFHNGKMRPVSQIWFQGDGSIKDVYPLEAGWPDAVIMQFTGVRDKHGREIYEGDIMGGSGNPHYTPEVKFGCYENGGAYDGFVSGTGFYFQSSVTGVREFNKSDAEQMAVIGHVYEQERRGG